MRRYSVGLECGNDHSYSLQTWKGAHGFSRKEPVESSWRDCVGLKGNQECFWETYGKYRIVGQCVLLHSKFLSHRWKVDSDCVLVELKPQSSENWRNFCKIQHERSWITVGGLISWLFELKDTPRVWFPRALCTFPIAVWRDDSASLSIIQA